MIVSDRAGTQVNPSRMDYPISKKKCRQFRNSSENAFDNHTFKSRSQFKEYSESKSKTYKPKNIQLAHKLFPI